MRANLHIISNICKEKYRNLYHFVILLIFVYSVLNQLYLINVLFFVTIAAFQYTMSLVHHIEYGIHRLVVGNTFRVVTLHDTSQFIRCFYRFLFHHLVVLDNVEYDFRCYHAQTVHLLICKKLIRDFDNPLFADLF